MKTFKAFIKDTFDLNLPSGNISGEWFAKHNMPMIVSCTCCGMTMVSPSAWVNDDGECFCSECADMDD